MDYPATGDWMFTKKFLEIFGEKLAGRDNNDIFGAKEYALKYLLHNHLVHDTDEEYKQFIKFYSDILMYLKIEASIEEIETVAMDRVTNMSNYVAYDDALYVVKTLSKTYKLGIISDT